MAVFDVNIIANYDSDIVPYLDSPVGSAYIRHPDTGEFSAIESAHSATEAEGPLEGQLYRVAITQSWSLLLEPGFRRRNDNEDVVLWGPGKTIWISICEHEQSPLGPENAKRLLKTRERISFAMPTCSVTRTRTSEHGASCHFVSPPVNTP